MKNKLILALAFTLLAIPAGAQQSVKLCTQGANNSCVPISTLNPLPITTTGGGGSVTSVGLAGDDVVFSATVTGSPVTASGTLGPMALKTQAANALFAGPATGAAATPTFRTATGADLDSVFTGTGILTKTATGSYAQRTVTGGSGISVTNGNGVSGNPTVAVASGSPQIQPSSTYTTDVSGSVFPYLYTATGGNASPTESGWGIVASLASDKVLQMRFALPSSVPAGTLNLVSYCQANATSGVAKYTISDANVAAGSNPGAASLSAETQTSTTWTTADAYVRTATPLTAVPTANGMLVVAVTFNTTGWTLAQIMSCKWYATWL